MTPILRAVLLASAVACTRGASPPTEVARDASASSASAGSASPSTRATATAAATATTTTTTTTTPTTNPEMQTLCGADGLPRLDERLVPVEQLMRAAQRCTVALTWDGSRAALSEGCALPGAYTELSGSGGGRFFGTNRVLLRPDEVPASCRQATHLVASFATWNEPSGDKLGAVLVPLPCPSVTDRSPAPGCIGAHLNGAERLLRARRAADALGSAADAARRAADAGRSADGNATNLAAQALEAFALAPDDSLGVEALSHHRSSDPALAAQIQWLTEQYVLVQERAGEASRLRLKPAPESAPVPRHDQVLATQGHTPDPLASPAFAFCFTPHFRPDWQKTWNPRTRKP